ncbi:site-specific DNA-methyltransferase [Caulobacter sp. B11]|uniref:site-specific DNA-methyltransferase n=1 Tax=Caulobacter sp. B11 TaxID=2048899 RepID=UPI00117E27C2|nr:site-specific DNA-methyltransferase [Caulobacter sp. B11]
MPEPQLVAISRLGDVWLMGGHRLVCGDALEASTYEALWVAGDPLAKLQLTDEPYNVKIKGHVTSGRHREFAMASGEMTDTDFGAFNRGWMARGLERLAEGALLATFIDWRHLHVVQASAARSGLSSRARATTFKSAPAAIGLDALRC